jgi:glyoxylase-like metal-dependent hydrolase (beta-lactamase superfamily II)
MTNPNRRALICGVAAGALAPLLRPSAARTAAPAIGKQAPGFYRYKVGSFECTSVNDGALTYPISNEYVTNVSKDQVIAAAEAVYFPQNMVVCPYNPQVINTGSKLVLIDTGWGPGVDPAVGQVLRNIAAAGIDPEAVDTVIVSHFHRDHINGLRKSDGALAFPKAEIKVPAPEWAFWMNDDNMSKAAGNMMQGNFANARKMFAGLADRVTKYEWGQEVLPGVTALETPGHTPGHTSFAVQSGSGRVLIQSDVTNIPALFLRHPDWHVMYDVEPDLATRTRHKFYDMASAEKTQVVGFHFPFPCLGQVEKDGAGYRLVPTAWSPVL